MSTEQVHSGLIDRLRQRDKMALSAIYDAYAGMVYGTVLKMVADEDLARELVQDVFLKVWNNIGQYDDAKGRLSTWIMNIARNRAIDELRSKSFRNRKENRNIENSVDEVEKAEKVNQKEDTLDVRSFADLLRPEQKQLIDLVYFNGYTHEEAAKELSIPLGTVKTRLRNSILELRKRLKVE